MNPPPPPSNPQSSERIAELEAAVAAARGQVADLAGQIDEGKVGVWVVDGRVRKRSRMGGRPKLLMWVRMGLGVRGAGVCLKGGPHK